MTGLRKALSDEDSSRMPCQENPIADAQVRRKHPGGLPLTER